MRFIWLCLALISLAISAQAERLTSQDYTLEISTIADDLDEPWAIAIISNERFLITERDGTLLYFDNGTRRDVSHRFDVRAKGQGGLLDVVLAKDFTTSGKIYLTYSSRVAGGFGTTLASAIFDPKTAMLRNQNILFQQKRGTRTERHFGSRVVEGNDGVLYLTIGDRGDRMSAQDDQSTNGKVIRIKNGKAEIYSKGHRNPQGATLDQKGRLWTVSHGPRGGDEINRPEQGKNYGWPVISYGVHYSGATVGVGTESPGLEQPKFYWDPSIAPSGMMIYSGKQFPKWKGHIFIGSLKFDMISRLSDKAGQLREEERMLPEAFSRIRDIREAPDGAIWFLSVGDGAAYRMVPAD